MNPKFYPRSLFLVHHLEIIQIWITLLQVDKVLDFSDLDFINFEQITSKVMARFYTTDISYILIRYISISLINGHIHPDMVYYDWSLILTIQNVCLADDDVTWSFKIYSVWFVIHNQSLSYRILRVNTNGNSHNDIQGRLKVGKNTIMVFYQFNRLSGSQKTAIIQKTMFLKTSVKNIVIKFRPTITPWPSKVMVRQKSSKISACVGGINWLPSCDFWLV